MFFFKLFSVKKLEEIHNINNDFLSHQSVTNKLYIMAKRLNNYKSGDISYLNEKIKRLESIILKNQKEMIHLKLLREDKIESGNHYSIYGQFFLSKNKTATTIDEIQIKFFDSTTKDNINLRNIEYVKFLNFDYLFQTIFEGEVENYEGFDDQFFDLINEEVQNDENILKTPIYLYYNISFADINKTETYNSGIYSDYYYLVNTSLHFEDNYIPKDVYKFYKSTKFILESKLELYEFLLQAWKYGVDREIFFPLILFLSKKMHEEFVELEFYIHYFKNVKSYN